MKLWRLWHVGGAARCAFQLIDTQPFANHCEYGKRVIGSVSNHVAPSRHHGINVSGQQSARFAGGQARVLLGNLSGAGRRALARDHGAFCAFADVPREAREHLHRYACSVIIAQDTS